MASPTPDDYAERLAMALAPAPTDRTTAEARPETLADRTVVTGAGVWVIDTRRRKGRVRLSIGRSACGPRLLTNDRDDTALLRQLDEQLEQVRRALGTAGCAGVQVRGALCFVDTELPFLQRELEINGRLVTWPRALKKRLAADGPADPSTQVRIRRALATSLAPAS